MGVLFAAITLTNIHQFIKQKMFTFLFSKVHTLRGNGGTVNRKNCCSKVEIHFVLRTWVWLLCKNREHLHRV